MAKKSAPGKAPKNAAKDIPRASKNLGKPRRVTPAQARTARVDLRREGEKLDELQKRNAELSQTTDDLTNLLIAVNIPVLMLGPDLRIRRFTPAAGQVLNLVAADLGRPLTDVAGALEDVSWRHLIAEVGSRGQPLELEVQDRDGHWHLLRMRPYRGTANRLEGILIALIDIDAVKRAAHEAEAATRRSEELEAKLALIGEGIGVGVWEYDIEREETRGSKQWSVIYGVPADKPVSRADWLARVHPDDHEMILADFAKLLQGGQPINREYRVVMPDGVVRWLDRRSELVRDGQGNPVKIHGVSIDITERKLAEEEKQAFSLKVASAQGAERQRIARELHDGLMQDLAALAVDLGRRATAAPVSPEQLKKDYQSLKSRVVKAAEAARHVAYELHPSELEDLGLENALRHYCEQFGREQGIKVELTFRKLPGKLKREIAAALYKVAQEGLRNVAKHSKAKKAKVILEATEGGIRLRVEDKGDGFHLESLDASDGLGVAGMRERIELVKGKFSITSEPGKGTRISAEVPMNGSED